MNYKFNPFRCQTLVSPDRKLCLLTFSKMKMHMKNWSIVNTEKKERLFRSQKRVFKEVPPTVQFYTREVLCWEDEFLKPIWNFWIAPGIFCKDTKSEIVRLVLTVCSICRLIQTNACVTQNVQTVNKVNSLSSWIHWIFMDLVAVHVMTFTVRGV